MNKKKMFLMITQINDLKNFVEITNKISCNVYAQRNEFIVDAKSLLGILSLDLTKPLCLISDEEIPENIYNELKVFSVE
jgi:hypothetical protein